MKDNSVVERVLKKEKLKIKKINSGQCRLAWIGKINIPGERRNKTQD